jgi:hypothetical protein
MQTVWHGYWPLWGKLAMQIAIAIRYVSYCLNLRSLLNLDKEFTLNPPRGLGQVDIILRTLQEVAFRGTKPFGMQFRRLFNPLPLPTIALLLTMVSTVIDGRSRLILAL